MPNCPDLTNAELRIMKVLWELESTKGATVAEVRTALGKRGQDLAYTTVMTLLGRLAGKGAVTADKSREPFVYTPAHGRASVLGDRLREFVREVFDGRAEALVLGLVEDEALSPAQLRDIERRIADAEKAPKSGDKPGDKRGKR